MCSTGEHTTNVRVHDTRRKLADSSSDKESPEIHGRQTSSIADDVKGNKRQQTGDEDAFISVFVEEFLNGKKCSFGAKLFHHISSQNSGDKETNRRTQHSRCPGQDAALPPSEQVRVSQCDKEGWKRCRNGLEYHQERGYQHRPFSILGDKVVHLIKVPGLEHGYHAIHPGMNRRNREVYDDTGDKQSQYN